MKVPNLFLRFICFKTKKILANNLDVTFGDFNVVTGDYGIIYTELPVTIKNKGTERKTFYITIEAIDENGTRIETDSISADSLAPSQKQNFKAFKYLEDEKIKSLQNGQL